MENKYVNIPCPHCGYLRKTTDVAPHGSCPQCKELYRQKRSLPYGFSTNKKIIICTQKSPLRLIQNSTLLKIARCLDILIIVTLVCCALSFWKKDRLPDAKQTLPALQQDPIQINNDEEEFNIEYRGTLIRVRPRADYQIWGLIISQNDVHHPRNRS